MPNILTAPLNTGVLHLLANVYMHNCGTPTVYACIRDLHSGKVALTCRQTNLYFVWLVGDSVDCHAHYVCRIRQARMGDANGSFETAIFHLMVNVCMATCGNSTANTCIRGLLS